MDIWIFITRLIAFVLWFETFTPAERIALAAAFLVLVGVAGEYVVEMRAIEERASLKKHIKRWSMALLLVGLTGDVLGIVMGQAEMAAITEEAGDAAESAHRATKDAKDAHDLAQSASDIAIPAKETAAVAKSEADAVKTESGVLKIEQSNLQACAEKLRLSILDRRFITADKMAVGRRLNNFRHDPGEKYKKALVVDFEYLEASESAFVGRFVSCLDCKGLAYEIHRILTLSANWRSISMPRATKEYWQFPEGVSIVVNSDGENPEVVKWLNDAADALKTELKNKNIAASVCTSEKCRPEMYNEPPDSLLIRVGRKPQVQPCKP
ncbi:MAG TPA: hypothetical protein VMT67_05330 [Terriglobales bacterium]|nr:hypothetical protein [Terriglobales bacterium]